MSHLKFIKMRNYYIFIIILTFHLTLRVMSSKTRYFTLWGKALHMVLAKEHLTHEGFLTI
jgi:hypothetical protein